MSQPQPRQQSWLNDMQMLQRQIIFKQLQELQRRQPFKELGDTKQQNYINQQSLINKHVTGGQFSPMINGTPIHDASQMFLAGNMNFMQRGEPPVVQGFSSGLVFSQAQSQAPCSMDLVSQQLDVSLYGNPIATAGNNLSQYSQLQGTSHDSASVLTKVNNNQAVKSVIQSSPFNNSFTSDQCNVSSNQANMLDGAFVSKQVFQEKNFFGQVRIQGLNSGVLPGNFQQVNIPQRNASVQEFGWRQELAGQPGFFPGKTTDSCPSQGLASLDPLEQKILFNMDDSWEDSFGRCSNMGMVCFENTTLEHTDLFGAFPSVQSGSWSALMQSAVAEASSSDTGLQEEWSGLSFQNPELSTDNQPSNFVDSGKQQTNWVDNNLQGASSLSSKPDELLFNNSNSSNFPAFQQSGIQFSLKQKGGIRSDSSHESILQSHKNASKWLDCNPQQKHPIEGSQTVQRVSPLQSFWSGQNYERSESEQRISSYTNGSLRCNNLTGWNIESLSPNGNPMLNGPDNKNAVNKIWAGDINGAAYKDHDSLSKTYNNHLAGSNSDSVGGLEQVKSGKVNTVVDRENSQLNNFAAIPSVDQETIRHVPEIDYMKHVDNSVKDQGNENTGTDQHHLSNSPQILANIYKEASETYGKRENSDDSHHSSTSQHTMSRHELRENVWLHERDSRPLEEGYLKPSGQVLCQRVPRGMSDHELGYVGQLKFMGDVSNSGMAFEKGFLPDIQRNLRASEEVPPRSNVGSNISAFLDRSDGFHGPKVTARKSQHMLELLPKVDKSPEYRLGMHFGSTDSTPLSDVPQAKTPDASVGQSCYKFSQCFGLRLAPPSQRLPDSNCFESFDSSHRHSSPQMGNSAATLSSGPLHVRNQIQNQNPCAAHVSCQSPQATLPGMGSRFPDFNPATSQDTCGLICANSCDQQFPILEAKPVTRPSVTSGMSQQVGFSTRPPNVWTNVPTPQNLSGTEPLKVPFGLLLSPDSTNSCLETASESPQELHDQNYFKRGNNSQEIVACSMNSPDFGYGGEQPLKERSGQQISSEILDPVSLTGKLSDGQNFLAKHLAEANAVASSSLMTRSHQQGFDSAWHSDNQAPAISASNIEAFGRSLKPSHIPPQNYSLLHQVHSVKNVENDPSKWNSEKYNGVDSDLNVQQVIAIAGQQLLYGQNSGVQNLVNTVSQKSGDKKITGFSSEVRGDWSVNASSQPILQDTPQEMVAYGQHDSPSHSISNVASDRTERTLISLQMAPSWFKHYRTLKNGQMLPTYNAMAAKNIAQQFSLAKPFENLQMNNSMLRVNSAGANQVSSVWPTAASTSIAVKHLSPPYVWSPDVTDQNLAVLRPKKRKISASELLPWHEEVTQGLHRLQNISMAELEWAQAANRLIEKVADEANIIGDAFLMFRRKKRLVLTTQLMQQLFQPAPAAILFEDATSNCDSVAYIAARLALGDACSPTSNSHLPCDVSAISFEQPQTSGSIGDHDFSKNVENLMNRSKRLEGVLLRLDKGVSIIDIRVESQELEKFNVINRLAKFHRRGQAGAAETSTSSSATPIVMKIYPQRYVTALPMPSIVPEEAECLSL